MTNEKRQRYEYSLKVNEEYINLLQQVNRVAVSKRQYEMPILNLFVGDKKVACLKLSYMPRRASIARIAQTKIAEEIERVEKINERVKRELAKEI